MKTVSSIYLSHIYEACTQHGADGDELLALIPNGDKSLQAPRVRLPVQCIFDILSHTEKYTNTPEIGLLIGKDLRPSALGDVGHAVMLCQSLRQAILINRRYQPLTQQIGRSNLKIMEGKAWLSWECGTSDPEYARRYTDVVMANHVQFGRWLSWVHNKKIQGVYFRHTKPTYADLYEQLFECPVYFGHDQDAMVFEVEAIDLPLPQPNTKMLQEICVRLDATLLALKTPTSLKDRVEKFILRSLVLGTPTIKQAAKNFGMSERNLRRHLTQEETNFRAILEATRKELCERLMEDNDLSLAVISDRLGYSEQSAFNRAFRSWYGQSPKSYQRTLKYFNTAFDQLAP